MAITLDGTNGVTAPDLTVDTDTLTVDTTNNRVGIGTGSPTQSLEVDGAVQANSGVILNSTNLHYLYSVGVGQIGVRFNDGDTALGYMWLKDFGGSTRGIGVTSGSLAFGTDSTERMRIDSSGNVGIGAGSPATLLHLKSTGPAILTIEADSDNATETDNARIELSQDGGLVTGSIGYADNTNSIELWNNYAENLIFGTGDTEAMRITAANRVGIGDLAPAVTLDVVGSINYTGTITDVSDRRLKENVLDLSDSLNKVCQLNAKSYTLIADRDNEEEEVELGFIAQEVQTVFPEVVKNIQKYVVDENGENTEEEINYLGVSYIQLVAPMVEAIKELKTEVDILKAKVTALEAGV